MTDQSFDSLLSESLPELPPLEILEEINPFKTAFSRILWGLALNMITLKLLNLDYILPALGIIIAFCGFRSLKNENTGFRICYYLSFLEIAVRIPLYGFLATIYQETLNPAVDFSLSFLLCGIRILMLIALRSAIISIETKAGMDSRTGSTNALIFWNLLTVLLSLLHVESLFLPVGILIVLSMIMAFINLARLSDSISDSGYVIVPSQVSISDRNLIGILTTAMLLTVTVSGFFFGKYRMNWQDVTVPDDPEVLSIQENLLHLGYPQDALNDLSEEDLLSCKNAKSLTVHEHSVYRSTDYYWDKGDSLDSNEENDLPEIQFTDVAVHLESDSETWQVFHHFKFIRKTVHYGTDSVHLWPVYRDNAGFMKAGEPSGKLLCSQGNRSKSASFHTLEEELFQPQSFFFGNSPASADPFGTFSFPMFCQDARGYVTYRAIRLDEHYGFYSWINYTHQYGPLNYPAKTAIEVRKSGVTREPHPFATVQNPFIWEMIDGEPVPSQ